MEDHQVYIYIEQANLLYKICVSMHLLKQEFGIEIYFVFDA